MVPPPDGAHAVAAPLRPPPATSATRPPRTHNQPNQPGLDAVHEIPGRSGISPAYPTCQPGYHEYLSAGDRQLGGDRRLPRSAPAGDPRDGRAQHHAVGEEPIARYLGPRSPQPPGQGAKVVRVDHQLNSTEPADAPP